MTMDRRGFIALSTVMIFGAGGIRQLRPERGAKMHGLIGKILAVEGRREELAEILIEAVGGMPGCLSYVVANDVENDDALWVTEVWKSATSHQESLSLPSVQEAIKKGRPLIAEFGEGFVTEPIGGHGLSRD